MKAKPISKVINHRHFFNHSAFALLISTFNQLLKCGCFQNIFYFFENLLRKKEPRFLFIVLANVRLRSVLQIFLQLEKQNEVMVKISIKLYFPHCCGRFI